MQYKELHFLTALRAFAALWVGVHHGFNSLKGVDLPTGPLFSAFISKGWLGVDLFFILSGFILAYSNDGRMMRPTWEVVSNFLVKRFARVYPAHFVTLILFVVIIFSAQIFSPAANLHDKFELQDLFASIFLVHGIGFLEPSAWNLPSWSVSSEFLVYLLFPFIILPLQRITGVGLNLLLIGGIFLLTIWLAFHLNSGEKYMLDFKYTWVRVISEFTMGLVLFKVTKSFKPRRFYGGFTLMVLGFIVAQGLTTDSFYDFIYLIYFMLLIHFLALIPCENKIPFFHLLGEISYSFYLIHSLVIIATNQIIRRFSFFENNLDLAFMLYLAISLIMSWIIFTSVEKPWRALINSSWCERKIFFKFEAIMAGKKKGPCTGPI